MNLNKKSNFSKRFLFLFLCLLFSFGSWALTPKEAGQKGMDYLTQAAVDWQNSRGGAENACFACHTQGLSMWGASIGTARGYDVNQEHLADLIANVTAHQGDDGLWHHTGTLMTSSIANSGLAFYDRNVATDAQEVFLKGADKLLESQNESGSWSSDGVWKRDSRDVLRFDSDHSVTAMNIVSSRRAFELTSALKFETAYKKATTWLKNVFPSDPQSLAYKVTGLIEGQVAKTDPALINTLATIKAMQNDDGGYGRATGVPSNPFHTGAAVYALRLGGVSSSDPSVSKGTQYLLQQQQPDGSWPIGSAILDGGDRVAPNMWAVIALGEFGEFGVSVEADQEAQEIAAFSPDKQTIEYNFTVTNTGNSVNTDTFDIQLSGGYPGFPAIIDKNSVTLASGESEVVNLKIIAPAHLPFGFPVTHSIAATSATNSDTFAITSVKSYTPPPPPAEGHDTNVMFVSGQNVQMTTQASVRFAVHVIDTVTNTYVTGSTDPAQSIGNVNFFVGGINIGGDNDADGNGVFEVEWTPGWDWTSLGDQSVLVTYSGIDKPEFESDLLFSFAITNITIIESPVTPEIIADNAQGDIEEIVVLLPVDVSNALNNHFKNAQKALDRALKALAEGDAATAIAEFEEVINKLELATAKIEKERCSVVNAPKGKNGKVSNKTCVEDSTVDIVVGMTNAVIADIREAIALLQQ